LRTSTCRSSNGWPCSPQNSRSQDRFSVDAHSSNRRVSVASGETPKPGIELFTHAPQRCDDGTIVLIGERARCLANDGALGLGTILIIACSFIPPVVIEDEGLLDAPRKTAPEKRALIRQNLSVMSPCAASRRFTAAQQWSRFQSEADSSINCIALHGKVNGADM
jgi:hypothetical protein